MNSLFQQNNLVRPDEIQIAIDCDGTNSTLHGLLISDFGDPGSSMGVQAITLDMPMDVVMSRHPEVLQVLLASRILCVGCPLSAFHSISDAAAEHAFGAGELLALLNSAITNARNP